MVTVGGTQVEVRSPSSGDGIGDDAPAAPRPRLRSVDAFRGAVLAFMVLTPATGDPRTYPFLRHAAWDGATASDLILPTFLVTSGLSLAFLLRPPVRPATVRRLGRRLVLLFLLGLLYNAYGATGFDLATLRATGVLQMIGISGFLAALVVLGTRQGARDRPALIAAVAIALPAAYGAGLALLVDRCAGVEVCSPYATWERSVLGATHTYGTGAPGYDPEGLAVSVAATSLVLVGYLAGSRLARASVEGRPRVVVALAAAGVLLLGSAWFMDASVDAVNKRLFTQAFVALASGVALLGIGAFVVALDLGRFAGARLRRVASPLVGLGRNALVVYLLERFLLQTASMVRVGDRSARAALIDALPVGEPAAHLAYTATLLVLIVAVTAVLHRRRRYLAL